LTQTLYEFGEFEIDCARFELRRNGPIVKLEHIPMELHILLAEKDGSVVTRQGDYHPGPPISQEGQRSAKPCAVTAISCVVSSLVSRARTISESRGVQLESV